MNKKDEGEIIDALISECQCLGCKVVSPGASEADVCKFESKIEKRLPDCFRNTLIRFDLSDIEIEFVRICNLASLYWENLEVGYAENLKELGLVAFAVDGCGDAYCFDYQDTSRSGNLPVVFFRHDTFRVEKPVNSDFVTFISCLVQIAKIIRNHNESEIYDAKGELRRQVKEEIFRKLREIDSKFVTSDSDYWSYSPYWCNQDYE